MGVVACGLTTVDLIQWVDHPPGPDEKIQAEAARLEFGGPAANAAFTAAALDGHCQLLTAVGPSTLGRVAADQIRAAGIELVDAVADDWEIPVSSVTVSPAGRSVVSINAADPPHLEVKVCLAGYSALLVDGHHLPLCLATAYEARTLGVPVLLDGGSWKPGLERLLPFVDAAVVSADFDGDLPDVPIAVTNGGQTIAYRGQGEGEIQVDPVPDADTLGAGDVFHGAWLSYVGRHGLSDFAAGLAYAAQFATFSCHFPGAHAWAAHRDRIVDMTPA